MSMKKSDFFQLFPSLSLRQKQHILEKITGFTTDQLFFIDEIFVDLSEIKRVENMIWDWVPFEYIVESSEFYWYDFFVDKRCLIPRNDTEIMVSECLNSFWAESYSLIDVGTGSSCIPISVYLESQKKWKILENNSVVDISPLALQVSQINLKKYQLDWVFQQIQSDLLEYFLEKNIVSLSKNVFITANLPYIKDNDFKNMDSNVYNHEPALALYWWKETWFELYEKLVDQIFQLKIQYNCEKIIAFFEIGFDQYEYSQKFLSQKWLKFEYFQDMAKILRCIKIEF